LIDSIAKPCETVPHVAETTQDAAAQAIVVDAAMGLRALGILLINCGTRDYTAGGYPVVRVLDADRKVEPRSAIDLGNTGCLAVGPWAVHS
jgi:hypothetical protein